jgi:hypothetical protein
MATITDVSPPITHDRGTRNPSTTARDRARRRALRVLTGITLVSLAMLAYLVLRGHTVGEQVWGPITAAGAAIVAVASLAFLAVRGRSRAAKLALAAAWLSIAVAGFGGYQSHRLAGAPVVDGVREGPPVAPLMFVGLAVAATVSIRAGSKEA